MPYRQSELRPPTAPRRTRLRWACGLAALPLLVAPFFARSRHETRRAAPEVLLPISCEHPALVAVGEDQRRDVLCGPTRVTLTPDGAAAAAERFEHDIVSATPVRDGWIFVTADGTLTRSATFLGPLHLLGRVPCLDAAATVARGSVGRAALLDTAGAVWTVDDASAVVRWTFPSRARGAAFRDAAHGAVVLDDGSVLATGDGGRSWPRVDLDGEVAWRVTLTDRGIVAETTGGAMRLTGEGGADLEAEHPADWLDARIAANERREEMRRATRRSQEVFRVGAPVDECRVVAATVDDDKRGVPAPLFEGSPSYRCVVSGSRGPWVAPRGRPPPSGAAPHGRVDTSIRSGAGLVTAAAWSEPGAQRRLVVEWSGRDRDGAFAGRAGPAVVESNWPRPPLPLDSTVPVFVAATSRDGLLLDLGVYDESLLWARAGGPAVSLRRPARLHVGNRWLGERSVSTTLPGGGVALVRSKQDGDRTVAAAFELGADGRVAAQRGLVLRGAMEVGLGRLGTTVGVVAWSRDRVAPGSFTPLDGSAARALPQLPLVAPTACATPWTGNDPGSLRAWINDERGSEFFEVASTAPHAHATLLVRPTRLELEWDGDSVCVRTATDDDSGELAFWTDTMTLDARPGGRFEGSINDQGATRVSCVPGPTPSVEELTAE